MRLPPIPDVGANLRICHPEARSSSPFSPPPISLFYFPSSSSPLFFLSWSCNASVTVWARAACLGRPSYQELFGEMRWPTPREKHILLLAISVMADLPATSAPFLTPSYLLDFEPSPGKGPILRNGQAWGDGSIRPVKKPKAQRSPVLPKVLQVGGSITLRSLVS